MHHSAGALGDPGPLGRRLRVVLLLGDVLTPDHKASLIVDFLHRDGPHEPGRIGTVPMILARFEVDTVTRSDDLDRSAASLASADAVGDVDALATRVSVPGCPGTWREVHAARGQTGKL